MSAQGDLEFRTGKNKAREILSFKETLRIYFSLKEIEIRIKEKIVYRKAYEHVLGSNQGKEWLLHLTVEQAVYAKRSSKDGQIEAAMHDSLTIISHEHHGTTYKNGELKRKLLQGANFRCSQSNVNIRGLKVRIPLTANPQTVWIRAELVPDGNVHAQACVIGGEKDDPAHRLSILVRYRTTREDVQKEIWYTNEAPGNIKKLNTLVDSLEDKDPDWTAKQPRRFLDLDHSRQRFLTSYTS